MPILDLPARAWQDLSDDYWTQEMRCYDPTDDDGDGETDDCPTPLIVVTPWDVDGGDDDRRRSADEVIADIRAAGGSDWDGIADPQEFLSDGYDANWTPEREAAALDNYDNWLTLPEREALDTLGRYFGPLSFDGVTAWLGGMSATVYRWWLDRLGLGHLPSTDWVITAPAGGGLAVQVRGAN